MLRATVEHGPYRASGLVQGQKGASVDPKYMDISQSQHTAHRPERSLGLLPDLGSNVAVTSRWLEVQVERLLQHLRTHTPDPKRAFTSRAEQRQLTERCGRSERLLNANCSAFADLEPLPHERLLSAGQQPLGRLSNEGPLSSAR